MDEVEYELAPKEKRPRLPTSNSLDACISGGEDTGAEADNEKSEYETMDEASLTGMNSQEEMDGDMLPQNETAELSTGGPKIVLPSSSTGAGNISAPSTSGGPNSTPKRKKVLVARPFGLMRGHTAFLTFATAGNKKQPDPNAT